MRPFVDDDDNEGDGEDVVEGVVDAVVKQLESELGSTVAAPPAEGVSPLPMTVICSVEFAGKSGVQRTQVVWMLVLRSFAVMFGRPFTLGSASSL